MSNIREEIINLAVRNGATAEEAAGIKSIAEAIAFVPATDDSGKIPVIPEIPPPVTPAAAQDDSEATDVEELVLNFNALLAKLRAAKLMDEPEPEPEP